MIKMILTIRPTNSNRTGPVTQTAKHLIQVASSCREGDPYIRHIRMRGHRAGRLLRAVHPSFPSRYNRYIRPLKAKASRAPARTMVPK